MARHTETDNEDVPGRRVGDELRGPAAGGKVVRGAVVRAIGYGLGTLSNVAASIVLLRFLGVVQFGEFVAVTSIIGVVSGVSDAGLTAVGNRELALLSTISERRAMVSRLFGMRLVITPITVAFAVGFTVIAGYKPTLVLGAALAGFGYTLVAASSALAMPLSVDLKIVSLTVLELVKQVGMTVVIVVLVVAGTGLLPFFAASVPGALLALALTPMLAGPALVGRPTFEMRAWGDLLSRSLPIAFASVIGVIYTRFLVIIMFQLTSDRETGLFGTSARILEAIGGLPLLAFMVALPVMSLSSDEQSGRLRGILQRMVETGMLGACFLVTGLVLGARPIIEVVGGAEYEGAISVLQIQSFALVGSLLAMACMMAAIAMDRRRTILVANTTALVSVVVLGVPAVLLWGARGAALATVVGESALGLGYWYLLGRRDSAVRPSLGHSWKGLLALVAGLCFALLSGLGDVARTGVGLAVFIVVALVTRAVPPEVFEALRLRRHA
jgi:O-antigen/teichoic acid export membrane protein